jgi:ribosomal protein S18 acetylase RimI-like enzyme
MTSFSVRGATRSDATVLAELVVAEALESEGRTVDPAIATRSVIAAIQNPDLARYWLLVADRDVAGAVAVTTEWSDWRAAPFWWLQFVYLRPDHRGQGHLATLLDAVRAAATGAGAAQLRLHVHPDNQRAIRAYERLGFTPQPYRMMSLPLSASAAPAPDISDDTLWHDFHARTLSHAAWTHAAHLRVAWLHLARYGLDEAHLRMRIGIIRLNLAHGLVETPQRGYHETLTRVWLALVASLRASSPCADSTTFLATHAAALNRDAPLAHYTRDRLLSLAARTIFVAPDLAPLP